MRRFPVSVHCRSYGFPAAVGYGPYAVNRSLIPGNQTLERVLYILKESPALAEKLNKKDGLNFDHLTLGKGRIQMVVRGKIVTIKIRIGNLKKIWDEK